MPQWSGDHSGTRGHALYKLADHHNSDFLRDDESRKKLLFESPRHHFFAFMTSYPNRKASPGQIQSPSKV